jgi:heterodisulfide reductase subunit C
LTDPPTIDIILFLIYSERKGELEMTPQALESVFADSGYGGYPQRCIQCGTCSASCPFANLMDHSPRELMALIRDGDIEDALCSNTPWFCVSCYQCLVRCPREIPVTDVMYALKQMAADYSLGPKDNRMLDFYRAFQREIHQHARISSVFLMARYAMRHPVDAITKSRLGLRLLTRGRLDLVPEKVRGKKAIRKILRT